MKTTAPPAAPRARRTWGQSNTTPFLEDTSGFLPRRFLIPVFVAAGACVAVWVGIALFAPAIRHLLPYQLAALVIIGVSAETARRGFTRAAAALFSVLIWALCQLPPFVVGHMDVPGIMLPIMAVLAAGVIWSSRAAMVLAALSALIWLGALWAGDQGLLVDPAPRTPLQFWLVLTMSLFMVTVFLHVATGALRRALFQARYAARQAARLMEDAPDAILVLDPEGLILRANPAVRRVLGRSPRQLEEGPTRLADLVPDEHLPAAEALFAAALTGETQEPFELEMTRPDGRSSMVEAVCRPVPFDGRQCLEVILRDITARRRLEQERLDLAEVVTMAQKMEAVGQLAGGVAHDFNNVLTVVGGCADLIDEDPHVSDSIAELTHEIRQAQEHASMLTRRLLAFAQRQVVDPRPLELAREMSQLEPLIRNIAGGGIELQMSITGADTTVLADAHQIEQVLVNLTSNARDAVGGSGVIQLWVEAITLDAPLRGYLDVVGPGSYVVLSVKDSGVGIDAETLGRIFDPFFSTKTRSQGSGLGLSAVLGIVRQAKGQIVVASEPGQGSRFSIYLPRASAVTT